MDFTGKVVIITGASSGIGASTAKLLAAHNAALTLVGRNEERLNEIALYCSGVKGVSPLTVRVDLTQAGSCEEVINRTVGTFGRIDVLVNCAGKIILSSLFDENIDCFDDLFCINLRVPYKLTHLALPHLVKTKGNVVNLKSAQKLFRQGFLNYSILNSAMEKFTQVAAVDVSSKGVRINAVSISLTDNTSFLKNMNYSEEEVNRVYTDLEKDCMIKILKQDEVAKMIVYVASDVCGNINGASIYLDGVASFKY
jgi:NAD(P)-dependent dehydrogenase (short-subunit alcohol dehydrogenase family)